MVPAFAVKLHRGLFWYYFDANRETPPVREEYAYPCSPDMESRTRARVSVQTDLLPQAREPRGVPRAVRRHGTARFLQIILMCYFSILDGSALPQEYIREYCDRVARDSDEDSFARNSGMSGAPDRKKKEREPGGVPYTGLQVRRHEARGSDREPADRKNARARARKGRHHVRVYVRAADLVDNEHVIQALDAEPTGRRQSSGQSQEYVRFDDYAEFLRAREHRRETSARDDL